MGYHDAETIRRAVDLLREDKPADAVLAEGVTPLSSVQEVTDWMDRAATHTAAHPHCCRAGAAYCPYAGQAVKRARRVIAAAKVATA